MYSIRKGGNTISITHRMYICGARKAATAERGSSLGKEHTTAKMTEKMECI
jgi:hypothetical protein